MANVGVLPSPNYQIQSGSFLTFITPVLPACNVACPFCIIAQRQEIVDEPRLEPRHYARFIREAASRHPVTAVAIQGYEPLLPSAIPYTQAILTMARELSIPASLVTNGIELTSALPLLRPLVPAKIAISLDSPAPEEHDKLRGKSGAWAATVGGIRDVVAGLSAETSLAVTSILLPPSIHRHALRDMPRLLSDIGIRHWMLSPFIRIGQDGIGRVPAPAAKVADVLDRLQDKANEAGIQMTVYDEFDSLDHRKLIRASPHLARVAFKNLPPRLRLFRLVPSGHCSLDADALNRLRDDAPQWRPSEEHAAAFLGRMSSAACVRAPLC